MRRRDFIALVGSAVAGWPFVARAQQADDIRRIGVLIGAVPNDPETQLRVKAFEAGLRELGWAEGRNLHLEYRWPADDVRLVRRYAAEIVELAPDVIFIAGQPALDAMRRATRTIPIVFVQVTDPVGSGAVGSLARPGGNLTGLANESIGGKWLELLKDIAPGASRVAVILDPESASNVANVDVIQVAALSLGMQLIHAPIRDSADIQRAFDGIADKSPNGLIVLANPITAVHRELIIELARRHRFPAVYPYRWYVTDGGLLSYGVDTIDLYRRAGSYVDRVLKGAKPAELPVQLPTKFELVINLRTAKALGLTVPPTLLARADEVIE